MNDFTEPLCFIVFVFAIVALVAIFPRNQNSKP
jgi:hypothetical protein